MDGWVDGWMDGWMDGLQLMPRLRNMNINSQLPP